MPPRMAPISVTLSAHYPDAKDDRIRSHPLDRDLLYCVVGAETLAFQLRQNFHNDATLPFTTYTGAWRLFSACRLRGKTAIPPGLIRPLSGEPNHGAAALPVSRLDISRALEPNAKPLPLVGI